MGKGFWSVANTIEKDYRNKKVKVLIKTAVDFSIKDMDKPTKLISMTISKIKTK